MPSSITMTDRQFCPAGVTILDQDAKPFAVKPDGFVIAFDSSDPSVAGLEPNEDGLNVKITSGNPGVATVTANVTFPDGTLVSDTIAVAVDNSAPGSINFSAGAPVDE